MQVVKHFGCLVWSGRVCNARVLLCCVMCICLNVVDGVGKVHRYDELRVVTVSD